LVFYRARTHSLVPIADCLIADDRVRAALPEVERFVATLEHA
jgi:tRNA/tmRNA/rRNA uracil-C5-methylase (TrmA/RlmC/RlmD family)